MLSFPHSFSSISLWNSGNHGSQTSKFPHPGETLSDGYKQGGKILDITLQGRWREAPNFDHFAIIALIDRSKTAQYHHFPDFCEGYIGVLFLKKWSKNAKKSIFPNRPRMLPGHMYYPNWVPWKQLWSKYGPKPSKNWLKPKLKIPNFGFSEFPRGVHWVQKWQKIDFS